MEEMQASVGNSASTLGEALTIGGQTAYSGGGGGVDTVLKLREGQGSP